MDESIFVAVSGIMKQERKMEILSNNLANMNNVGFKKDQLAFEALLSPFKKDTSFEASRLAGPRRPVLTKGSGAGTF